MEADQEERRAPGHAARAFLERGLRKTRQRLNKVAHGKDDNEREGRKRAPSDPTSWRNDEAYSALK